VGGGGGGGVCMCARRAKGEGKPSYHHYMKPATSGMLHSMLVYGEGGGEGKALPSPLDDKPPAKLLSYTLRMLLLSADVITYIVECFLCPSCKLVL